MFGLRCLDPITSSPTLAEVAAALAALVASAET